MKLLYPEKSEELSKLLNQSIGINYALWQQWKAKNVEGKEVSLPPQVFESIVPSSEEEDSIPEELTEDLLFNS